MYASFFNHAPNILKFLTAFTILFIVLPRFIFPKSDDDKLEDLVSGYIRMVFLVIVLGYILVVVKLYELVSILCVFGLLILLHKIYLQKRFGSKTKDKAPAILLDSLEGEFDLRKTARIRTQAYFKRLFSEIALYFKPFSNKVFVLIFIVLAAFIAYMRFYDAIVHASVPLSDSYTTLAWFKNVESNILFYNNGGGVYPRGLSMNLAMLHKFSNINELYILKYTGPLNSVFICLSIYFFVFRMTAQRYAGLIAMTTFGIGGYLFGLSWERQPATNSQELAMIFLLPVVYYTYKYIKLKRRQDLFPLLAAVSVTGLVHSLIFAVALLMAGLVIVYSLLVHFKNNIFQALHLTAIFGIAGLISALPILIGKVSGVGLNDSAVSFLTASINIGLRKLTLGDNLALAGIGIITIYAIYFQIKHKRIVNSYPVIAIIGISVFIVYFAGGALTKNEMVASRFPEPWAVISVALVGIAVAIILNIFKGKAANNVVGSTATVSLLMLFILFIRVPLMEPYKMEWDSSTEQYLKIAESYPKKSWFLVAEDEQFALVYGWGFTMSTATFLSTIEPDTGGKKGWAGIAENVFIYQQKNIFRVGYSSGILAIEEPIYERREREKLEMQAWLDRFKANGGSYNIFYEDKNLRVIHIINIDRTKKTKSSVW